jgi:hypothetical protein
VTSVTLTSSADTGTWLKQAKLKRSTEPTLANAESSRSHFIVKVEVSGTTHNMSKSRGTICFVDLGGVERSTATGAEKDRLLEARSINNDLTVLRRVFKAIRDGDHYLPYRDSQLTYLLKPSLVNSKVAVSVPFHTPCLRYHSYVSQMISTISIGDPRPITEQVLQFATEVSNPYSWYFLTLTFRKSLQINHTSVGRASPRFEC